MKRNENSNQGQQPTMRRTSIRTAAWFSLAAILVAALAFASPAAWAETDVPPDRVGGTVPPGQSECQKGTLVALPDINGTTQSTPITIHPVDNDKTTPPAKDVPEDKPGKKITTTHTITLTSVTSPTHGTVSWEQVGVTTTVTYTPDGESHGADNFTYTIEDDCGRTATGRIVVVVFPDDMPSQPAIITRPVGPGSGAAHKLPLPVSGTLTIPAEIFAETDANSEAHFFTVTDLGQPQTALEKTPGPGKNFASVAFGLSEYRNSGEVKNPTYQVPLILEIAFNLGEGEAPVLFYWNEENNAWQSDGIQRLSYNAETGVGIFAIYHLTEFAVFADSAASEILYLPSLTTGGLPGN